MSQPSLYQPTPEALARARDVAGPKLRRLFEDGISPNTRRTVEASLRYFFGWTDVVYGMQPHLPVAPELVRTFIALELDPHPQWYQDLVDRGVARTTRPRSPATIQTRLAALSKAHRLAGVPEDHNPCKDPTVRELLTLGRRAARRRGWRPRQADAMTAERLESMVSTCDDDPRGLRDAALLRFMFSSGGRRRSEARAARIEDLQPDPGYGFIFTLRRSKTTEEPTLKAVFGRAATAMEKWLEVLSEASGPLFRRVDRHGNIGAEALSTDGINLIFKRRAEDAGLERLNITGHSARSGFVTTGMERGIPPVDLMAAAEMTTLTTLTRYGRQSDLRRSRASYL